MIVLDRYYVTDSNLTGSNLTETDAPEWDAGTTYAAGDEIMIAAFHRIYVSAIDGNIGNEPPEEGDPEKWILKGATNKWAAFDEYVADRTSNADEITYQFTVTDVVTSIAFFNLSADSIEITVTNGPSTITYTAGLASTDHINGSLWNWLTGGRPSLSEFAFTDLAYFGSDTIYDVKISKTGGVAQVGQIVLGSQENLGVTAPGARLGRRRFDRLTEDPEFGSVSVTRRLSARITEMNVSRVSDNFRATDQYLDRISGTFTVFIGSEESELGLILFGYLLDHVIIQEQRNVQRIQLQIRSLI